MRRFTFIIPLVAMTSCAPSQWDAATTLALAEKRAFSDQEAKLLREAPCAATVGALLRMGNERKRAAILTLCEPE